MNSLCVPGSNFPISPSVLTAPTGVSTGVWNIITVVIIIKKEIFVGEIIQSNVIGPQIKTMTLIVFLNFRQE